MHSNETVRNKAVIALHRLFQLNPEAIPAHEFVEKLRRALCDRDPAVMGASLCVIERMVTHDPSPFKDLVSSLVSILKQIIEHRLPSDFDYHRMPAPWMQMAILRILAILADGDAHASSECYEVISDCLTRADVGANAGYAVVYECIRTITKVYPNPVLLDAAAESISRFIASRSHNLKYLGVTGLASTVEQHPKYEAIHQLAVVECLEDRDETLQRKTLELLYKMTNPVNVEFITDKLLSFLEATTDMFLKRDLTNKIGTIAERYAPNQEWYVRSITKLFEINGEFVFPQIAHNLMTMIAEGEEDESEESNMSLRKDAVELYASLLENSTGKNMPKVLADTVSWVLGEYAYLSTEYNLSEILEYLCAFAKRRGPFALSSTRRFLISAIMKLVAQLGTCPSSAASVIDEFSKSSDTDLQQRCLEFQNLLTNASSILGTLLPVDASCEDVDAVESLSELDWFVAEARANGALPYSRPIDEEDDAEYLAGRGRVKSVQINITPYEKPMD
jgi:AP-4 complex subunit epsilon-1